jgi:hypothetical protein
VNPIRKLWYNLTITAASVVVAVFVGGVEALGLVADRLRLDGAFWGLIGELNASLSTLGYAVVGIFAASWIASSVVYRWKGYDRLPCCAERTVAPMRSCDSAPGAKARWFTDSGRLLKLGEGRWTCR